MSEDPLLDDAVDVVDFDESDDELEPLSDFELDELESELELESVLVVPLDVSPLDESPDEPVVAVNSSSTKRTSTRTGHRCDRSRHP